MINLNNNRLILGISFLLLGVLSLLDKAEVVFLSTEDVLGIVFIFYAIPTVYLSLNDGKRERLVSATILFFVGIVFIVRSYFEIPDTRGLVFVSILFISGSVFFILFIENTKEKIFFTASATLILLSFLSLTYFKGLGLFETANKIGNWVGVFWPVILIVLGLSIFINRKK